MLTELLKTHRERRGMTQGDLAHAAGISTQTVNYIERGKQTADRIYASTRKAIFLALDSAEPFSQADRAQILKALELPENLRGSETSAPEVIDDKSTDNPHILAAILIERLGRTASADLFRSLLATTAAATQGDDEPSTTTLRKVSPPVQRDGHTEQRIETITAKTPAITPPKPSTPARPQATKKKAQ